MTNFLLSPINDAPLHRLPPPTVPAPATGTEGQGSVHVLEPGQSPEEVASLHGVTEQALRMENDLGPGQAVYPGTPLRIPASPAPGPGNAREAQAAGLTPFDPNADQGDTPDAGTTCVPDFKSMGPGDIQKYLESPEFKQMAATEREVAERLYNAGMKQAAVDYLTNAMKSLPPEVAARLAKECKELLGQLAKDAAGDKQVYAALAGMAAQLMKSPDGPALLREFARTLAGSMSDQQVREFLQSLHAGAPGGQPWKILVLQELLARVEAGTLNSVQDIELRNAITGLVQEVYQDYHSAQAAKAAKDAEFMAMLARLGNSLTNEQKQELYRKFMDDPENAAIYERAAAAALPMAEVISVACKEVVATILNRYELSDVPDLIASLARYGQGIAATEVLLVLKTNAKALELLKKDGVDMVALERMAGASALAQATVENGGDVRSALHALFEALKGSFDDVDGLFGNLEKVLDLFPEEGCPTPKQLADMLGKAGPLRDLVGGILSMAVVLTASSPAELAKSMDALMDLGAASVDTAGGIVAILAHFASENGKRAVVLKSAAKTLEFLGKAIGFVITAMSVGESLERQLMEGKLNWEDMSNIVSGLVAIAAAFPTPASPFLAFAAVVLDVGGKAIASIVEEREMQAMVKKYLVAIGFDEKVAETFAANPDSIRQLADAGFTPEQIAVLARRFPALLSGRQDMLGLDVLTDALKAAGLDTDRIMDLLTRLDETGLRYFLQAIVISPELRSQLQNSHGTTSVIDALDKLLGTALPEEALATIRKLMEELGAGR